MTHADRVDELIAGLHPLFRALGEPLRLTLLRRLLASPGGMTVTELVEATGSPQSTVSRHLGVLREAGVVRPQIARTTRIYRVDITEETLTALELLTATIRDCGGRRDG